MIKKIYAWYCFVLWGLWSVGLGATAISKFRFLHENQALFWDFVLPYNDILHIISYIPIAPILFLIAFVQNKRANQRNGRTVFLFLLTALLWLVYLSLYIRWTE